jgi:hypothetical protein
MVRLLVGELVSLSLLFTVPAAGNLIVNPGFESPVVANPNNFLEFSAGDNIGGWTVISNSANTSNILLLLNNSYSEVSGTLLFTSQSGQQNLDLTGPNNLGDNGVQQTVATVPGQGYSLSFYVGNQDNRQSNYALNSSVELDVNGAFVANYTTTATTANNVSWQQFTYTFTASSANTTVAFLNSTPVSDNYAGLDTVDLELATATAPEPGSLILMLTVAVFALLWHFRRA